MTVTLNRGDRLIEVSFRVIKRINFQDSHNWPLNRGWSFNIGPLNTGLTVFQIFGQGKELQKCFIIWMWSNNCWDPLSCIWFLLNLKTSVKTDQHFTYKEKWSNKMEKTVSGGTSIQGTNFGPETEKVCYNLFICYLHWRDTLFTGDTWVGHEVVLMMSLNRGWLYHTEQETRDITFKIVRY